MATRIKVEVSKNSYEVEYSHSVNEHGKDSFKIDVISEELKNALPLDFIVAGKDEKGLWMFMPSNPAINDIVMKIVTQVSNHYDNSPLAQV